MSSIFQENTPYPGVIFSDITRKLLVFAMTVIKQLRTSTDEKKNKEF